MNVPTHFRVRTIWLVLALFGSLYVLAYLSAADLPGRYDFPLGWWGWNDQGLYLKSARAVSRLDFNSSEHWYPILYSVIAAPFVRVMPIHPFFLVDLICFLIVAGGFLKIGAKIIGLLPSAVLFLCVMAFPPIIAASWIIPWTSTLSSALTTLLLLMCADEPFAEGAAPVRRYLAFGLLTGLVVLARPLDFVIDLVMSGYVAIRSIAAERKNKQAIFSPRLAAIAAALTAGALVGPAVFAIFNFRVYGSLASPYMLVSQESGYSLASIPQKFVSLFDDSAPLFLLPGQTFLARFPWLALTIAMIPPCLAFGGNVLRLITILVIAHFAAYLAYGDLIPENLYVYGTIHYFKLWVPYCALIAVSGLFLLFRLRRSGAARWVAASGFVLAAALCSLGFGISAVPLLATRVGPSVVSIEPSSGASATVAFIDFPDLASDERMKYEIGNNQLIADGKRLRRLGDVHLFKTEDGTRALFTRPIEFRKLLVTFDESFRIPSQIEADGFQYTIKLCSPTWLRRSSRRPHDC